MGMFGIICNNYECNGSIQIKFGCVIEIIFVSIKKGELDKCVFDENKFLILCDIVVIKI